MEYECFSESGIDFKFEKGFSFRIEKSKAYSKIGNKGIKTVDFLHLKRWKIWIVEVKSTSPHYSNEKDLSQFIDKITNQLHDSFSLFLAMHLKRHLSELPTNFQQIDLEKVEFKLALLLTNSTYHNEDTLEPLKRSLEEKLNPLITKMPKIWNFSSNKIMVINTEMAKQYGLINN